VSSVRWIAAALLTCASVAWTELDVVPSVGAVSTSASPTQTLHLVACPNVPHARCGTLRVPLDRTQLGRGTIGIRVEMHPRRNKALPLLGTIVAVQGGPGYATRQSRSSYLSLFHPLMDRYRLLMIDNRGTGGSEAIDCPALQSYRGDYVANAGACGRQLGATAVDYGTADAADDLADVVTALGIDKIDLYGDSYGTFFGQVFAVRHGDLLRSLVLDSAYPVAVSDPWYRDTNRALRYAFRHACSRVPTCAALPDGPMLRLRRLTTSLRRHPIVGTAYDADGVPRHVTVDVGALITFVTAGASSFDLYRELDPAIRAYLGPGHDARPLLRLAAENLYFSGAGSYHSFSEGLYLATNCNDIPLPFDRNASIPTRRTEYAVAIHRLKRTDPRAFAPFTVDEWLSAPLSGVQPYDSCILWPRPSRPNPPLPPHPVYPSIPVLVLSGDLDSLTSPEGAHEVASEFPNSTFVDVRNMNHIAALSDFGRCASTIVVRFVQTLSAGDTSCAQAYNEVRMVSRFAVTAADLGPMGPGRRSAEVAAESVADVIARWWVMYGYHGRGLRGGRFATAGLVHVWFHLNGIRWVRDAAVSGMVHWDRTDGRIHASVSVAGSGVTAGQLSLMWNDWQPLAIATARGTVGGRAVDVSFPAP
jgi:pimeloyl-ACP methyl ester carboxylesterase